MPEQHDHNRDSGVAKHHIVIGANLCTDSVMPFNLSALMMDNDYKCIKSVQWLAGGTDNISERSRPKEEDVFLPIIEINAGRASDVDNVVSKIAIGDILIPKISVLPTKVSCVANQNQSDAMGKETFDLTVQFELQKFPPNYPEQWKNWGLEFLSNQLYDCFAAEGAQKMNHPFEVTLASGIVWESELHMYNFLARVEKSMSERGSYLISDIYLLQNGVPTNFFKHNMTPPYSTRMCRCLISNVINKTPIVKDVTIPLLASSLTDTASLFSLGLKRVTSVVSPYASVASLRWQTIKDDWSSVPSTHAAKDEDEDDSSNDELKHFNHELYRKMKIKTVNVKGISEEQAKDHDLKNAFERHPELLCMKQVRGMSLILSKGTGDKYRIVVPKSLQQDILHFHRDCLVSPTKENNFDTIIYDLFTWDGIRKDVKLYVEKTKRGRHARAPCKDLQRSGMNEKCDNVKNILQERPVVEKRGNDENLQSQLIEKKGCDEKSVNKNSDDEKKKRKWKSPWMKKGSVRTPRVTEENDENYCRLIVDLGEETENLKVDFFQVDGVGHIMKLSGTQELSRGKISETNRFEKYITLDTDLCTSAATSRLSKGVLTVTIPKNDQPITITHH